MVAYLLVRQVIDEMATQATRYYNTSALKGSKALGSGPILLMCEPPQTPRAL